MLLATEQALARYASKQRSYSPSPKVSILDQVLPPLTVVVWNKAALVPTELSPNMLEGIYGPVDLALPNWSRSVGQSGKYRIRLETASLKTRQESWLARAKGPGGNEMQACLGRGKSACWSLHGILSRGRATRVFEGGWYL